MILPLLLAQTSPIAAPIDRCLKVHTGLKSASVILTTRDPGAKPRSVDLAFIAPDRATVRILTPRAGLAAASDRTFTLVKNKVFGYDKTTNEWLVRDVPAKGSMAERLSAAVGELNQAMALMLNPKVMSDLLSPLKSIPGWTISKNSAEITASNTIKSVGSYRLRFAVSDGRLLGLAIKNDDASIDWSYRYGAAPAAIDFRKPSSAEKVAFFKDRQSPPVFADPGAKKTYAQGVRAYEQIGALAYTVTDDSGKWAVSYSSKAYTQSGPGSFSWTAGRLIATSRTGSRVNEKCSAKDLPYRLSKLGVPVEPMLRIVLLGYNPFERMFTGLKVRSAGSISVGGVKFTVLEASKAGYRLTAQLRSDNNLLGGSLSEQLDAKGRTLNRTERRFAYK